jgi:beta-barrel assembly-enhancing protease
LREEKAVDYGRPLPVFASHPQSKERRDDLQLAANAIAEPGKKLNTEAYRAQINPYINKWLDDEVSRRMFNASLQVLNEMDAYNDPQKKGLFTFYRGEVLRRRNREGDKAQAAQAYASSINLPGTPAGAWREHGLVLKANNQKSDAIKALEKYLQLNPKADDRAFIEQYLKELKATP